MKQVLAGEVDRASLINGSPTVQSEGYAVAIEHEGRAAICTYIDVTERNRALAALEEVNGELEQRRSADKGVARIGAHAATCAGYYPRSRLLEGYRVGLPGL
ncbi:MAG: hypothetical protein R2873_29065 [Caldilineaceae bacterium]